MDDLILVSKQIAAEGQGCRSKGRPLNSTFSLRSYDGGNTMILSLLPELVKDGDRIDFYLSNAGFAVMISPAGERSITKSNKARTAGVPMAVRNRLRLPEGTTKIKFYEDRGDGMYFFPFDQFSMA